MHRVFQGIYESVEFAKLKLLARALDRAQVYEGGRLVVSYLLRSDFTELERGRGVLGGDHRLPARGRGRRVAALIREPPRREGPARRVSLRASDDELDVSAIARLSGGGGHRQAAGFSSEQSIEEITDFIHGFESPVPPRALSPSGLFLVDKPEGPSSFTIVADVRRRTGARTGHAGTLDPFATGLLLVLSGAATKLAPCFVGLDKRYVTDVDLRSPTDDRRPGGRGGRTARPAGAAELERAARGACAARSSCRCRPRRR